MKAKPQIMKYILQPFGLQMWGKINETNTNEITRAFQEINRRSI